MCLIRVFWMFHNQHDTVFSGGKKDQFLLVVIDPKYTNARGSLSSG